LASYLVYRLVLETTEDKFIAAIAAGIFSLHPTKVETAAWISGLSDSLSAVFFLASMIAYFKWRKAGATNPRLVAGSAIFLLLALFSKEAAVFASVLIAIYEFSAAKPGLRNRCLAVVRSVWPFVAVTLLAIATRIILVRDSAGRTVNNIPFLPTVLTAPQTILWYLGKQLWPVGLSIHYPIRSVTHLSFTGVVLPLLLLLTLSVLVVAAVGRRPIGIFFLSWFVIMLAPTILYHNILQEHDRYFYFASIATSIGLAYVVAQTRRVGMVPQAVVVLTFFGLMAAATFNYESYWDNDTKLFSHAAQIAPNNPSVTEYLASIYISQHNFEKAESIAEGLIKNSEMAEQGWYTLGNVRFTEGKYEQARSAMQNAVQLSHGHNFSSNVGLATMDLRLGNYVEAARIYEDELKVHPDVACLHGGLATALTRLGRTNEAARELELQKRFSQN
jgi:tetratricopeptide (TPR) repeat protein